MAIYVIHAMTAVIDPYDYIVDVTTSGDSAAWWKAKGYIVEEQDGPTMQENFMVDALEQWLVENYNRGGHWIYETTARERHVVELRAKSMEAYKAEISRDWELIDDYASDIKAA